MEQNEDGLITLIVGRGPEKWLYLLSKTHTEVDVPETSIFSSRPRTEVELSSNTPGGLVRLFRLQCNTTEEALHLRTVIRDVLSYAAPESILITEEVLYNFRNRGPSWWDSYRGLSQPAEQYVGTVKRLARHLNMPENAPLEDVERTLVRAIGTDSAVGALQTIKYEVDRALTDLDAC